MQYRTAFSKPYWSAGLCSQSTAKLKSTLNILKDGGTLKFSQSHAKRGQEMQEDEQASLALWHFLRITEVRYRKPQVWRDFCQEGHAVGPGLLLALCPSLKMGSSKAAVLCLVSLPTAYTFLGVVSKFWYLWPSFIQHCIGFSCLTRGGVSMDKGYILVSRYFCVVNETPCSG